MEKIKVITIGILYIFLFSLCVMINVEGQERNCNGCLHRTNAPPNDAYECDGPAATPCWTATYCSNVPAADHKCQVGCAACTTARLVCNIFNMVYSIVGIVGAVMIVASGLKWAGSGSNPKARDNAKNSLIHVVVGLIIVTLAVTIVLLVYTSGQTIKNAGCIGGL